MDAQLGLLDDGQTIQNRFERFHIRHPEVYDELVRLAEAAQYVGRRHIGIRMLWERMRWTFTIERDADEDFKLNDHYHSRYVRLICELRPDLAGMFHLRELRSA